MGAIAGSNMEVGEMNSDVQVKAMGNILRGVIKKGKERKKFHNQTIRFWNKYVNVVRVSTFSIIVTSFCSFDIKISSCSIIIVLIGTVLLGMSRLSLST